MIKGQFVESLINDIP